MGNEWELMSYIKLDRKITDWEWFTNPNTLMVWIYLLTNAQYQDGSYRGVELKRGQLLTGRRKLSEKLGLTERQIRTCLKHLESTNEIAIESTNKNSLITIIKYAFYQGGESENDQQSDQQEDQKTSNKRPTKSPMNDHNTRNKEVKKEKNIYIRPSLDEVIAYCTERGNSVDPQKWFDYYTANGWKVGKNPMKDWKACVRTWERNTNARKTEDVLPTYSTTNNKSLSIDEEQELLRLIGEKL